MRYAVVSDIHSNLQAWNAVLIDIRSLEIDRIICLGDIVGYGPDPVAVLKSVHATVHHIVLGNHDAVICGKMNPSHFNDGARQIIMWTRQQLGNNAIKFLSQLPLSLCNKLFRCAHGEFANPAMFEYILDPQDAIPSWNAVNEQLLFIGHTHVPAIFLLGKSGTPHLVPAQDFAIEAEKRYILNVGSVGQPRNGDTRACYVILDTDDQSIRWRQVPFDLDAYRIAIAKAGIPERPSYFLRHDPRLDTPAVRDLLDFAPASNPNEGVTNTVEVEQITDLKRSVSMWKTFAIITLTASIIAAIVIMLAISRHVDRHETICDPAFIPLLASTFPVERNMLALPDYSIPAGNPIPGWMIILGNKHKQSVSVQYDDQSPTLVLISATHHKEMSLSTPEILTKPGTKFCIQAMFRKSKIFSGNIAVIVAINRNGPNGPETLGNFVVKEPTIIRSHGWVMAKKTFVTPANTTSIVAGIQGAFVGEIAICDISLQRKD